MRIPEITLAACGLPAGSSIVQNPCFDGERWDEFRLSGGKEVSIIKIYTGYEAVPALPGEPYMSGGHRRSCDGGSEWYIAHIHRVDGGYMADIWKVGEEGPPISVHRYNATKAEETPPKK